MNCKDLLALRAYSEPIVMRFRCLYILESLLEPSPEIDDLQDLLGLDDARTLLVNSCAKAAPAPATISLAQFSKRAGFDLTKAGKTMAGNIAGFYLDDFGQMRVDLAAFDECFGRGKKRPDRKFAAVEQENAAA